MNDGINDFESWLDHVHEKANNRMVIRASENLKGGLNSITVRTADNIHVFYYI